MNDELTFQIKAVNQHTQEVYASLRAGFITNAKKHLDMVRRAKNRALYLADELNAELPADLTQKVMKAELAIKTTQSKRKTTWLQQAYEFQKTGRI